MRKRECKRVKKSSAVAERCAETSGKWNTERSPHSAVALHRAYEWFAFSADLLYASNWCCSRRTNVDRSQCNAAAAVVMLQHYFSGTSFVLHATCIYICMFDRYVAINEVLLNIPYINYAHTLMGMHKCVCVYVCMWRPVLVCDL